MSMRVCGCARAGRSIVGMALSFFPLRNDPSKTTGEFYLSVAHIKAYRKRDEPEMVYVSDAVRRLCPSQPPPLP
eukprot:6449686-Prymnesium_polylepis.1